MTTLTSTASTPSNSLANFLVSETNWGLAGHIGLVIVISGNVTGQYTVGTLDAKSTPIDAVLSPELRLRSD